MHFVIDPSDLFVYRSPSEGNRFCLIKAWGDVDSSKYDSKHCASDLFIEKELTLAELAEEIVMYRSTHLKDDSKNTVNSSLAINTGSFSLTCNTGRYSSASSFGNFSSAVNTGDDSLASSTGNRSSACNTGEDSIAAVFGKDSCAKGALGCWLILTERDEGWHIVDMKCVKVDDETIKADTWYQLKDGKVREYEE